MHSSYRLVEARSVAPRHPQNLRTHRGRQKESSRLELTTVRNAPRRFTRSTIPRLSQYFLTSSTICSGGKTVRDTNPADHVSSSLAASWFSLDLSALTPRTRILGELTSLKLLRRLVPMSKETYHSPRLFQLYNSYPFIECGNAASRD
jgi:hypothetical protein